MKMEKARCIICNSSDHNVMFPIKNTNEPLYVTNLVQCSSCGLLYVTSILTKAEINSIYSKKYYSESFPLRGLIGFIDSWVQLMDAKRRTNYKKTGRVLDVGCGTGEFLRCLQKIGWETFGLDISESACRVARKKLLQNIFNCELKDCHFPDKHFDVITLIQVFEHLYDPKQELKEIYRILKDDGILVFTVPNINSLQFRLFKEKWISLKDLGHLYYYSPTTIRCLLNEMGFLIDKINYFTFEFAPFALYNHLLGTFTAHIKKKTIKGFYQVTLLILAFILTIFSTFASLFGSGQTMEVYCKKRLKLK